MRIVVRLAGESLAWQYKDSERLGQWLDSRPWLGPPTVQVVRVADTESACHVVSAIVNAVNAADHQSSDVRTRVIDSQQSTPREIYRSIAESLGIRTDLTILEIASKIVTHCNVRPTIWLIPPSDTCRQNVLDQSESLAELASKLHSNSRFCILLFDTAQVPLSGRCFDLTAGAPTCGSDLTILPDAGLWLHYLHRRIAWEAAGVQSCASRMSTLIMDEDITPGDDGRLETTLATISQHLFEEICESMREKIRVLFENNIRDFRKPDRSLMTYFWNPGCISGTAPVPWIARSLLASAPRKELSDFLRASLLCIPIAQELLTLCFLMESQIRARVRVPPQPPMGAKCDGPWRGFLAGRGLSSKLYPASSLSVPANAWAFASLGELLNYEVNCVGGADWRHEVRLLRNHLAHGHYVGWEAIRLVRQLLQQLE